MKKVTIICAYCQKKADVWYYRQKTAKYCSPECRYKNSSLIAQKKREAMFGSGKKRCPRCMETKPFSEFYTSKQKQDGYDTWCKKCKLLANHQYCKHPEVAARKREFRKKYNLDTKDRRKFNRMKHLYGVTFEQYNSFIISQQGKCKICGDVLIFNRLAHIDHDHGTNLVRGILCHNCNSGLGNFKDNTTILQNAIQYLTECHKTLEACKVAEEVGL